MANETRVPEGEYKVLQALAVEKGIRDVEELARELKMDQSQVAAAVVLLERRGWVETKETKERIFCLTEAGAETVGKGLPERRILQAIQDSGGQCSMKEIAGKAGLEPKTVGGMLRFLRERDWAKQEGPLLHLTDQGRMDLTGRTTEEQFLSWLAQQEGQRASETELESAPAVLSDNETQTLSQKRRLLEIRTRKQRFPQLSDEGRSALGKVKPQLEVSQLTPELLASGEWKDVKLKRYNVRLDVTPVVSGKIHPLQAVIQETRNVFLRMGFTEITSPFVESAFWDFDALFQPQDHPAREMQDTFYMKKPSRADLPGDNDLVNRVHRVHEDGGDTGSRGWEIPWSPKLAQKTVLRTHTTAATVRALAKNPEGPQRVFCVGRVFRREAITYKHLPVFTQVEGIIIDEGGTFSTLLGTLGAFYEGMGFTNYEFRPAFFPYTEPSVEIFIYYEPKKTWIEMGGAGVFRPEVTHPLGCKVPVLAWGLGLERLAMLRYGVKHMRDLYVPDIQWLKEAPICPSLESR